MSEPLSIVEAAASVGDIIAVVDGDRALTFEECARRAGSIARGASIPIPATRTIDTILAVHAALEARWPIALLDPAHPPDVIAKLHDAVARATLPADAALVSRT